MAGLLVNNELVEGSGINLIEVLSRNFPTGTEENKRKLQSGCPIQIGHLPDKIRKRFRLS
jgi:hypothetical protein